VEIKLKTDRSIRRAASDSSTQLYRFHCIRPHGQFSQSFGWA
jgi:hypothetical protein